MTWRAGMLFLALAGLMTGCTMQQLPPYTVVQDETRAALQRIVDEFPPGTDVESLPDGDPIGCGGGGDGVLFTARVGGYPPDGFDGQAWVDALPSRLVDDFTVQGSAVDLDIPAVMLRATAYGGGLVSITVVQRGDDPVTIGIVGLSRCAQQPETPAP